MGPPKGGRYPKRSVAPGGDRPHLALDVLSDHGLITPHRGDEKSAIPEALADAISIAFSVQPREVDGTFSPDKADHLRHRVFRRDQDQHNHMADRQNPFRVLGRSRVGFSSMDTRCCRPATPGIVKLLLPPRQSRGNSHVISMASAAPPARPLK